MESRKLTHLSLFSGIGDLDLAAEAAGIVTVGQIEYADFPRKVLEKNFPDVERWRDGQKQSARKRRSAAILLPCISRDS